MQTDFSEAMPGSHSYKTKISIIIPVYNDQKKLKSCLAAVARSTYVNYECIVVDDNSDDSTVEIAKQFQTVVIELSENRGPAHARNNGARISTGDILFFVDSDVVIFPDTLEKISQTFVEHGDVDAIIGSYDDTPHEISFVSEFKNLFHHYVHQKASEMACSFWSGCGAIRKDIFTKVGGFNETFKRPAIEDIELGYRLTNNHHKILLNKELQVKHLKRWTFWGLIKTDVLYRGIPWTHLMLQDKNIPNHLNVSFSQRACVILAYLLLLTPFIFAGFHKNLLFLPILIILTVLIINIDLYKFFVKKKDVSFAAMAIPFHFLYYYYSGLSFFLGLITYPFKKG